MTDGILDIKKAQGFVLIFIMLHVIVWTLVPTLIRLNLPLDSIEGIGWGQEWQWGYDKNPFLNGWLSMAALALSQQQDWGLYFFCQVSVAFTLLSVWLLAKEFLPPASALLSVLLLETVQYFNFHALDFNDNTLELGLWAVAIYCFYRALHARDPKTTLLFWIATAFSLSLGFLAKYYTLSLIAAMGLFLLYDRRAVLKTYAPYVALMVFLLLISPHLVWLHYHDYITVHYVFYRAQATPAFTNHLLFPLKFLWQQLEVILPAIIILGVFSWRRHKHDLKGSPDLHKKRFLYFMAFGPILLTALLSLIFGNTLRAGWGMPLQSLWGIVLVLWLRPKLGAKSIYGFFFGTLTIIGILASAYAYSILYSNTKSSANFPGKLLATQMSTLWHQRYFKKLEYVAGSRWLGGNISHHSLDRPHVFMEWHEQNSPWVQQKDFLEKGAIFVWDISAGEILPETVKKRYPRLTDIQELHFSWHRDKSHKLPPIRVGVALLPPES